LRKKEQGAMPCSSQFQVLILDFYFIAEAAAFLRAKDLAPPKTWTAAWGPA